MEDWPAKSSDLNIIENLWSILARNVYENGRQFQNTEELKVAIVEAWNNINQATVQALYRSMQQRMIALYDAGGNWTE